MVEVRAFAEDVWTVDGPPVRFAGLDFPTRMVIVKLAGGLLWVNSPVAVPAEVLARVKALGTMRYLVAPTRLHVWRLAEWHGLFPEAELWMPSQVPKPFQGLPFAGTLGDTPPPEWADELDQLVFQGNLFVDEVFFLHRKSRTVMVADFLQSHPIAKGRPLRNMVLRLEGIADPQVGVPRDIRLSFMNRERARRSLARLLSWEFDKLILAHGPCLASEAKGRVAAAFRWLGGPAKAEMLKR